jgi:hypothetical protein
VIFLDDFGGQTSECAIDSRAVHDARFFEEIHAAGY